MKKYQYILLLILPLAACNKKSDKEKVQIQNAKEFYDSSHIIGIGKIIPEQDIIQLSSPVNGIVERIYKSENDSVNNGTVILSLVHHVEDGKMELLERDVSTQASQINVASADADEFERKIKTAKTELQHLQNLLARGAETQQRVDEAVSNLQILNTGLQRAQAGVQVSNGNWLQSKAALQNAAIERELKMIKSPIRGTILELTVLAGGSVAIQQSLGQIYPEGRKIAICEIDELHADKIAVGQTGWIRNAGSLDTLSTATVYFTSSFLKKKSLFTDQSGEKEDRRVRTIKLMLNQPEKLLLNARVECVIEVSGNTEKN